MIEQKFEPENQPECEHDNTASLFGLNDLESENHEPSEQLSGDEKEGSQASWDMLEDKASVIDFKKLLARMW